MLMALIARPFTRCRLVFDFRGLLAEEYADANIWAENSLLFRAVKFLERVAFRRASQVVVLTRRVRDWLVQQRLAEASKIEVIPCCVDFERFDMVNRDRDTGTTGFEIVYAGSVTGLYLLEEMGRFFLELQALQPTAFLRILTPSEPQEPAAALQRLGLNPDSFWIGMVLPSEVPLYMSRARLGHSLTKPTFSQIAASPTKIPEYLAAGLPVVSSTGVGDTDELLIKENVGIVVNAFDRETYKRVAVQALSLLQDTELSARCTLVAHRYFDLINVGGAGYCNLYRKLEEQQLVGTER